jgi:hypothetical protein
LKNTRDKEKWERPLLIFQNLRILEAGGHTFVFYGEKRRANKYKLLQAITCI